MGGGQRAVDHGAGKRKNTENSVARHAQCEEWRWTERAGSRVGSSGYQSASQRSPYLWFRGLLLPLEQEQQRRKPNPEQGPQAQHRGAWFVGACASAQFTFQTLSGPIFRGALLSFGNAETRAKLLKLLECISIVFPEIVE
jgi:hypothetical protein